MYILCILYMCDYEYAFYEIRFIYSLIFWVIRYNNWVSFCLASSNCKLSVFDLFCPAAYGLFEQNRAIVHNFNNNFIHSRIKKNGRDLWQIQRVCKIFWNLIFANHCCSSSYFRSILNSFHPRGNKLEQSNEMVSFKCVILPENRNASILALRPSSYIRFEINIHFIYVLFSFVFISHFPWFWLSNDREYAGVNDPNLKNSLERTWHMHVIVFVCVYVEILLRHAHREYSHKQSRKRLEIWS